MQTLAKTHQLSLALEVLEYYSLLGAEKGGEGLRQNVVIVKYWHSVGEGWQHLGLKSWSKYLTMRSDVSTNPLNVN